MPGQGQQIPQVPIQQAVSPIKLLTEINGKLDAIMEHIGCEYKDGKSSMSREEYLNASEDKKDKIDEGQVLGRT